MCHYSNSHRLVFGKRLESWLIVVLEEGASHECATFVHALRGSYHVDESRQVPFGRRESWRENKPGRVIQDAVDNIYGDKRY